jgi:hypothetical protein
LKIRHWLLIGLLSSANAWAGGLESLEAFVKTVKSGRAEFTQTVTAPPRVAPCAGLHEVLQRYCSFCNVAVSG